jgi:hypothetical protein
MARNPVTQGRTDNDIACWMNISSAVACKTFKIQNRIKPDRTYTDMESNNNPKL